MKETKRLLAQNLSYDQAEKMYNSIMISPKAWEQWKFFWHWSAYKFSSKLQDKYFDKHGYEKLTARINRVRKVLGLEKRGGN